LSPDGHTVCIPADLRDPAAILAHPVTKEILDFSRPVGVAKARSTRAVRAVPDLRGHLHDGFS
jgi:hypothetical protein